MAPSTNITCAEPVTKVCALNVMRGIDMKLVCSHKATTTLFLFAILCCSLLPIQAEAKKSVWISQLVFPDAGEVSAPASLALDMQRQRYYVVDSEGGRLLSFDNSGVPLGDFDALGQLILPTAMTFARPGKMWLVERADNSLLYIDMETQNIRKFSPRGADGQQLIPDRIATDAKHRLYLTDRRSGRIYALDDNLKIAVVFAPPAGGHFIDFKIKGDRLWALERGEPAVYSFNLKGGQEQRITLQHQLDTPVSLEIGSQQQLYILDRALGRIYRFTRKGQYIDELGQKGYRRGQLNYPSQLLFNWQQQLCIVNQGNDRIEVFKH